jgi:hypothetical protein
VIHRKWAWLFTLLSFVLGAVVYERCKHLPTLWAIVVAILPPLALILVIALFTSNRSPPKERIGSASPKTIRPEATVLVYFPDVLVGWAEDQVLRKNPSFKGLPAILVVPDDDQDSYHQFIERVPISHFWPDRNTQHIIVCSGPLTRCVAEAITRIAETGVRPEYCVVENRRP